MTRPRIRVYIVDDHALVREWLGNMLRLEKDIEVVGDAAEPAIGLAEMEKLLPDIAVVDLSLKYGSGIDLIKAITERLPAIRPLVLSMHEETSDVQRALRAGARGYVMKADATRQIVPAIRQVNAGKVFADPQVLAQLAERMVGRKQQPVNPIEQLSDRELEVFRRMGSGHSTRRIADDLNVSQKTVQTYCARIKEKMSLGDGRELLQAAIKLHQDQK